MKIKIGLLTVAILSLFSCEVTKTQQKPYNEGIHIIPYPKSVEVAGDHFTLTPKTQFILNKGNAGDTLNHILAYFNAKISASTGDTLRYADGEQGKGISLSLKPEMKVSKEGYLLNVLPDKIEIEAPTYQGIFYAMQTLMQLLPAEIESKEPVKNGEWQIPCVKIYDEPGFPYRGMMLDVCRHFYDVDFIKKQLDVMAMLKMNRFHWHLTDDHLWTIEIKKYPLLTQIGANRKNAEKTVGNVVNGFYTQEQIKEIVKYAADRYITVIPEVELPGHALAALSAYPELSCTGGPFELRTQWGVEDNVYCAGNEKTFDFLADVLQEIIPLFPGKYFHIGGDECPKVNWENCSKCKMRMQTESLKTTHELQSYFVRRIEKLLLGYGKAMIGWDEILEGGLAQSATVMSWRGEQGGIEAAGMGHDVIMTPGDYLYIDHAQGGVEVEPPSITFSTLLSEIYNYNPVPKEIPADKQHHILGAQGNMWTEYAATPQHVEYMIYPRLASIAEITWTPAEGRNFADFCRRIENFNVRLDNHGINYHIPQPEGPKSNYIAFNDTVILPFANSRDLPMVYTTDGSTPNLQSRLYSGPLSFTQNTTVKIASYTLSGKLSPVRSVTLEKTELSPSIQKETKPGMIFSTAKGKFYTVADTKNAEWGNGQITSEFFRSRSFANKAPEDMPNAILYTGYIDVPKDGTYYFASEVDELQVDNKVVLKSEEALTRHFCLRSSVALQKGKHAFRILCINENFGGFLRRWNNPGFQFAYESDSLKYPTPEQLSHE